MLLVSGLKGRNFYPFWYKNSFQDYYCATTLRKFAVDGVLPECGCLRAPHVFPRGSQLTVCPSDSNQYLTTKSWWLGESLPQPPLTGCLHIIYPAYKSNRGSRDNKISFIWFVRD